LKLQGRVLQLILKINDVFFGILVVSGVSLVLSPQVQASRECTVYTDAQLSYAFNQSLFTSKQKEAIAQFTYTNALEEEAIILDLRYLGEHQCEFAVILPNRQVRWPTTQDVDFAYSLNPEDWFYMENNKRQRYYLLPRGVYTESFANPIQ
jgi:hypothetical protein